MINIVIPMAGRGSRFVNAGYTVPKPLIEINGRPMIEIVVRNLTPAREHRFLFICQKEHLEKYDLRERFAQIAPGCVIIPIEYITEGAACTVLLSKQFINNDDELMIANSDQYIDFDINEYLKNLGENDGLIMTLPASGKKWSYIKFDENGYVTMVREKEEISNEATTGIYNYSHGSDFVKYAEKMIKANKRVNNEFYVAPVYNEMIEAKKKIAFYNVGEKMYGLGTPEDLNAFLETEVSKRIV